MPKRRVGQLEFLDVLVAQRGRSRPLALMDIASLVDWAPFEKLSSALHVAARGEPSDPALVMFKTLLLQRWHGLSDPEMETALADRLSFTAFVGLSLGDPTPDHSTIWRFRKQLGVHDLLDKLLAEANRQIALAGLMLRQGPPIDATLVTSAARRPRMDEGKMSATDKAARFGTTSERGRFAFGYKMHVAVDAGSGLVRDMKLTPANVQDVAVAPQRLDHAAGVVYADLGEDSDGLRAELARRELGDGLMRRRRGWPLTAAEVLRNHQLSLTRRAIESLSGTMKRSYRLGRMRAFTQLRNAADLTLFRLAFNLRRWRVLAAL
ncbi:MAG: IS5 family transposase [Methylocystis sp.]|uniref:IS5 family transposase n=1 Tax=Methylocystis sp. TaxID=1911079 RepID=UPI0039224462